MWHLISPWTAGRREITEEDESQESAFQFGRSVICIHALGFCQASWVKRSGIGYLPSGEEPDHYPGIRITFGRKTLIEP
jgi:hypothetical protein